MCGLVRILCEGPRSTAKKKINIESLNELQKPIQLNVQSDQRKPIDCIIAKNDEPLECCLAFI